MIKNNPINWFSLAVLLSLLLSACIMPAAPTITPKESTLLPTPAVTTSDPTSERTKSVITPTTRTADINPKTIHALRADYTDMAKSREQVQPLENKMRQAGINMVSLGAGRAEWTYFKWEGHEDAWSGDVKTSGIDYLLEDSSRFGVWAHVDATVDVLSPLYIQAHPEAAAVSADGEVSKSLVSTMSLVEGDYGKQLLGMIEAIAANYPVDSISLTELFYHRDGYGADDKAAYLAATGKTDWPRNTDGSINIDDPSIGNWRSAVLDGFIDKAVAIAHKYGKEFYLDVSISLDNMQNATNEHGTRYDLVLQHTDKIIVWGYFDLESYEPEFLETVARYLVNYGSDRVILSIGLWNKQNQAISAERLQRGILASQKGGMNNLWITPASLMDDSHWQVLIDLWGK
jgi:hypothetical protein